MEASQIGGDHTHRHGAHSEEEGWPLAIDHQVGALQLVEKLERRSKSDEYNSMLFVPGRPEAPPHQSYGEDITSGMSSNTSHYRKTTVLSVW